VLCDSLHVWILWVLSLCYTIPSSLLLYEKRVLSVFLLVLLLATTLVHLLCQFYFQLLCLNYPSFYTSLTVFSQVFKPFLSIYLKSTRLLLTGTWKVLGILSLPGSIYTTLLNCSSVTLFNIKNFKLILLFFELLWVMARETKSLRPFCRKQEFYYASRLRGGKTSKPWAPISVRRWVIFSLGGLCNQVFFFFSSIWVSYRKTSWLQNLALTPL
jgi:hypothetical protein